MQAYIDQAARKSEVERMVETREKTGVFTGGYVINPLSGERIPVWIADYVLPDLRHRRGDGRAGARRA